MRARSLTISAADVESRIRQRLIGVGNTARHVVWQTGDHAVLLRSDRVRARLLEGWLMVSIELQTDQTGRRQLELVYRLGALVGLFKQVSFYALMGLFTVPRTASFGAQKPHYGCKIIKIIPFFAFKL